MPDLDHSLDHYDDADTINVVAIARRVAGDSAATALMRDFGGTRLYVPQHPGPDHQLTRSIGPEAAAAVASECYNLRLYVPIGMSQAERRRAMLLVLLDEGATLHTAARRLRVSERTIGNDLTALRKRGVHIDPRRNVGKHSR
ncbi:MAG TPA: helix-turn-helix domain-containing protein [Allosphingosinicella sp.]|jgi:biotin operon repressor